MKRITCTLLAVLLLLTVTFATTPALATFTTNPSGVIVGGNANVFAQNPPLLGATPLGTIPQGAQVVVTQQVGAYTYVMYFYPNGGVLQGWVPSSQVRVQGTIPTQQPIPTALPTPQPPIPTAQPQMQGVVISESLTVRAEPSTNSRSLGTLQNGARFTILRQQNDWYYINYRNPVSGATLIGWVSSFYVVANPQYITLMSQTFAYAMPDRAGKRVGQLAPGTQVLVIGDYGDYLCINLRTASAFIYKLDITR